MFCISAIGDLTCRNGICRYTAKREAGEKPARTRRCKRVVLLKGKTCHWTYEPGRRAKWNCAKPEDLHKTTNRLHGNLEDEYFVEPEKYGTVALAAVFCFLRRELRFENGIKVKRFQEVVKE